MWKNQFKYVLRIYILSSFVANLLSSSIIFKENNNYQAIINFDPYVSTLDKANPFRYEIADLQVLIAKVATQFSRIYIEFTINDLKLDQLQNTSRYLSPLAAAMFNTKVNKTKKVEVLLGLDDNIFVNETMIPETMQRANSIIRLTNIAHAGTLTTLVISQNILLGSNRKFISDLRQMAPIINLRIGMFVDPPFVCDPEVVDIFQPNLIILRGNSYFQFSQDLQQQIDACRSQIGMLNNTTLMGAVHHVPDTGADNIVNTLKLVKSWNDAVEWAKSSGHIVIFSTAFDLPYKTEIANKTAGCWRLLENSSYTNVSEYIFEEKSLVANQSDWEESPKNNQWLRDPIIFHSNFTGMFFHEDEISREDLTAEIFQNLMKANITKILIIDKKYLKQDSIMKFGKLDALSNVASTTLLNRYSTSSAGQNKSHDIGLYFSRSTCDNYENMETTSKRKLFETLGNPNHNIFMFYYIEKAEIVKLGARRMFQQRIVKLDVCREMVVKSGNMRTQIGYVLLEYTDLSSGQKSPWALQNIVKYYKLLNEWTTTQTNVILFLPGLDRMKVKSNTPMLGWWRVNSTINETHLINKQADALDSSKADLESKNDADEIKANEDRIVLIVTTAIAMIVTLTTLSILFVKRRSKGTNELLKHDIDIFYHGMDSDELSDTDNYSRIPYDKERYEIEESKFSFDSGIKALGKGEFGRVLRGKVNPDGIPIDVAIKTTNPETNHMYALKGLLSEIKLLAYIGKHENITELIGANTENLKRGKCWIILELCHLGSLQNYLRDIRIPTNNVAVEYSNDYVNCADEYENIPMESSSPQLDVELSNDLYRWSLEICSAMVYLAEKHVIHADLATRNVLLDLHKKAKICDFGLSRRMYNYTDYVKTNQEPLPWKWMAPESLRFMQFSEKSDVWSFGITLWEIYSLGEVPYQGMSWDINFAQILERGLRLSEPRYNEHNMFEVMQSCWKITADQRPTFSTLFNLLTTK